MPAPVDLIITGVVLACAFTGASRGFISSASSLLGFALGLFVASRLAGNMLPHATSDPRLMVWSMLSAVVVAFAAASICEVATASLRSRIQQRQAGVVVDRVAGALIAAVLGAGLVWVGAAAVIGSPRFERARPLVTQSRIVGAINQVLPSSERVLGFIARHDPLPTFNGPNISDIGVPSGTTTNGSPVRQAAASVVRIVGEACGYEVTGSGWVAAPHRVVTNAHVVAGEDHTAVQEHGAGRLIPARVIWFDTINDIAILDTPGVQAPPLTIDAVTPQFNHGGAILGYPENGPFMTRPVRIGHTRAVRTTDITDSQQVVRSVTAFRGDVRHGNSGGPVVNAAGAVIGTVFASAVDRVEGGYAVPTSIVVDALTQAGSVSLQTGPCV